ncbi:MAG: AbrB/MazE/SpoVT family DNA-binding domain-containing protein [bacterium]
MKIYKVKISSKGQISIPAEIRKKLSTSILEIQLDKDRIILKPSHSILSLGGTLRKYSKNKETNRIGQEDETAWKAHIQKKFNRS